MDALYDDFEMELPSRIGNTQIPAGRTLIREAHAGDLGQETRKGTCDRSGQGSRSATVWNISGYPRLALPRYRLGHGPMAGSCCSAVRR